MSPAKVIPLPGQRPKEGWEFLDALLAVPFPGAVPASGVMA